MSAENSEEVSSIAEEIDIGIDEGQSHEETSGGEDEGSPSGRHGPPFLNLNLDCDSGVVMPPGNTFNSIIMVIIIIIIIKS